MAGIEAEELAAVIESTEAKELLLYKREFNLC